MSSSAVLGVALCAGAQRRLALVDQRRRRRCDIGGCQHRRLTAASIGVCCCVRYPGGKNGSGVWQAIISLQPPHDIYVEPFLGSGAILRHKRPARVNYGFDLDVRALSLLANIAIGGSGGPGFHLVRGCGLQFLECAALSPAALVYCDPPYLMETRSCRQRYYKYEFGVEDHRRLLAWASAARCMVQISGYPSSLYCEALRGWSTYSYNRVVRSGRRRLECLWFNYPWPVRLHDYRYIGRDYHDRTRIRRKCLTWSTRLSAMPDLERRAVLAAMLEAESP